MEDTVSPQNASRPLAAVTLTQRSTHALQRQAGDRMSVDYCMTIVSQFLAKLLAANRSLSHANRVSGRSFPRSGETVFGRQRQKARTASEAVLLPCRDCKPALRPRKTAGIR